MSSANKHFSLNFILSFLHIKTNKKKNVEVERSEDHKFDPILSRTVIYSTVIIHNSRVYNLLGFKQVPQNRNSSKTNKIFIMIIIFLNTSK